MSQWEPLSSGADPCRDRLGRRRSGLVRPLALGRGRSAAAGGRAAAIGGAWPRSLGARSGRGRHSVEAGRRFGDLSGAWCWRFQRIASAPASARTPWRFWRSASACGRWCTVRCAPSWAAIVSMKTTAYRRLRLAAMGRAHHHGAGGGGDPRRARSPAGGRLMTGAARDRPPPDRTVRPCGRVAVVVCAVAAPLLAPFSPDEQLFDGLTLEGAPIPPDADLSARHRHARPRSPVAPALRRADLADHRPRRQWHGGRHRPVRRHDGGLSARGVGNAMMRFTDLMMAFPGAAAGHRAGGDLPGRACGSSPW